MVESLSSFTHRLAEAHGLPTWILVRRELAPLFERKSILGSRGGCELLGKMGGAINGNNVSALEAVRIMQMLTGHANLSNLTLAKLRSLVARRKLIRNCQAWCPRCLDDWRDNDRPIYQPLLWMLSDLTPCPQHGCRLQDRCPQCGKAHTPLGRYRWNGRCPRCLAWLGASSSSGSQPSERPSTWDQFSTASIARFMVAIQALPTDSASVFSANLAALIKERFGGNTAAITKIFRVTRRTVRDWSDGRLRPSLTSLLTFEYCFGASAVDWIRLPLNVAELPPLRSLEDFGPVPFSPTKYDPEVVRLQLTNVIEANEFPVPSLRAVCFRSGFHQTVATRMFPELARKIIANFKSFQAEKKRSRKIFMKAAVESAVNQLLQEGRSLSFHQLAKILPRHISVRDKFVLVEFARLRKEAEDEMQAVMQEPVVPAQTT